VWSQQLAMATLLVQSCSKSKNQPPEAVPAVDLYSGFFFRIIKKAMREEVFIDEIDLCILSAKHGLIDADSRIEWYDQRMDSERADELAPAVRRDLYERVTDTYDTVVINVGKVYQRALDDVVSELDADVYYIDGEGIGEKGHRLKRLIRGDFGVVTDPTEPSIAQ
jgi:cytoplasmic iron level regulating protein YaaA (DUF328/UPF0246 family)